GSILYYCSMHIYTIGFTQKPAQTFFDLVRGEDISTVFDVRLNNVSQLAGFAKKDDLAFFLDRLCGVDYVHMPELAPTAELLQGYRKRVLTWPQFEEAFLNLMAQRNMERSIDSATLDKGCLLCSEHKPHHCHRRLVVDYLNQHADVALTVRHLY